MANAQQVDLDPSFFTLREEDDSIFERAFRNILKGVSSSINIPREHLTSYGSSLYNMEANARAFRKRLQTLVDESKLVDYVIHGTWETTGYAVSKTGYASITQVAPLAFGTREIPFRTKYAGPHRPRRALRKLLKLQIGHVQIDASLTPVKPANWITFTTNITPMEDTP